MNREDVIQFLDDCCAAAPENSSILEDFDRVFAEVAADLGIRLAPRDDPDKSFAPRTFGTVLGIYYDTVEWTWTLPQDKLIRLLHLLKQLLSSQGQVEHGLIMSMAGKIINICPLVPAGKFNIVHIIKASGVSQDKRLLVSVPVQLKRQMFFWFEILRVCSGRAAIPDLDEWLPAWALDVYTDAAGGSCSTPGLGCGAVAQGFWAYLPWSHAINSGRVTATGRRLDRAMSALELVGPLLTMVAGHRRWRGHCIRFWVDNSGSVGIWRKGYSTCCPLSTTLVRALNVVATGLGCRVDIVKITRCSTAGADMADALSKFDLARFWAVAEREPGWQIPLQPALVPRALQDWIGNPVEDEELGSRLLDALVSNGAPSLVSGAF